MDKIINLGIPHIGEEIFERIDTAGLFQCFVVSETWNIIAKRVLLKRNKKIFLEACRNGETKVVQLLLQDDESEGIDLNATDWFGRTGFSLACENGHQQIVQLIVDRSDSHNIDLDSRDKKGWTALMRTCGTGRSDIVRILLNYSGKQFIDFNAKDKFGVTPFMIACGKCSRKFKIVKLLLNNSEKKNIDLNAKDNYYGTRHTAFMNACEFANYNLVKLLINCPQIDTNIPSSKRYHPMINALLKAQLRMKDGT